MQKNKNRKGLALGAMVSLVASLFVGVAPAQANTGSVAPILPLVGTTYNMIHNEGFSLRYVGDSSKRLTVQVAKPASVDLSVAFRTSSAAISAVTQVDPLHRSSLGTATSRSFLIPSGSNNTFSPDVVNQLFLSAPSTTSGSVTSMSASITVTVNVFEDLFADGVWEPANEPGRTVNVVFHPWSALDAKVSLTQPALGDTHVTASAAVASVVNLQQLKGRFYFQLGAPTTLTGSLSAAIYGYDATPNDLSGSGTYATGPMLADGHVLSASALVGAMNTASATVSAQLFYRTAGEPSAVTADEALQAQQQATIAAKNYRELTFSAVVGDNVVRTAPGTAKARINSAFAVTARAVTGSGTTLASVATGTSLYFSVTPAIAAGETLTVHTRTVTGSNNVATAALPLSLTGATNIAISTANLTVSRTLTLTLAKGNDTTTYVVTIEAPVYEVSQVGAGFYATAPNTAVTLDLEVKDQFGVLSTRTGQRVSASAVLGSTRSAAVTAAVVGGKASVAITPTTGTNTGSATVTLHVEHLNQATGVWSTDGNTPNTSVKIEVTALANGFTTSPDATASAKISYNMADDEYSWSNVISGSTRVAGAVVTVAGEGLVFTADNGATTASGTLTFRSGLAGKFDVRVAGTRAGDHEITFTAGAATAVSVLTIDPAVASAGTEIEISGPETALPNRTLTYTGSVVDALGNPVADADVTITVLGPVSLILGSQGVTTDVDGEFTFRVQTSANDEGDISVTATYNKNGKLTLAKDKISAVALTTVAAPVVVTADKVTVEGAATVTTGLSTDVVVTVVDADGNALAGRNVSLRSSGPGFLNVQSAVSDTDGKVVVKFIATAQAGEVVITAIVDGKVGTHTLKVEAPVVVVPEINAVIGTFNGRWAVRVENAKGAVVSVKVGARWFQFTALNDNYLFSRASRTGATVPVAVYVNGQLENVATITIR